MGPMFARPFDRRRVARWSAVALVALFLWSFIAAPAAQTEELEVAEPESLSAYSAQSDAAPVVMFADHQTRLVPLTPTLAHSVSEVSLPSAATGTAWILDNGVANALHGTTTGNKVPTEATASQPGGAESGEFLLARQSVGNDAAMRFGAGVARALAEHSDRPRGYSHAYLGNLVLLPAPGSPDQPPGSYDPADDAAKEEEHPETVVVASGSPKPKDDPRAFTPNPRGQMGIVTVGSVASTSETIREDARVISIAVAELNGINIGNRTADGRCGNCITIDSLRIEARAESDSTKGGALAEWRLLIHRACRVSTTNDAGGNAFEKVDCLDPNPDTIIEAVSSPSQESFEKAFDDSEHEVANGRGVRKVMSVEKLNELFAKGLGSGSLGTGDLGIRMHFGTTGARLIEDAGEAASAFANGLEISVSTKVASDRLGEARDGTASSFDGAQEQCEGGRGALPQDIGGRQPPYPDCPFDAAKGGVNTAAALRTVKLTLGKVSATAIARPGFMSGGDDDGGGPELPGFPEITIPEINIPSFDIPSGGGGGNTTIVNGLSSGRLRLKVNWASVRVKPWAPKDVTKGVFSAGIGLGLVGLVRRRFRLG